MGEFEMALGSAVSKLSDQNYAQSLAFYRLWFEIGQTYPQIPGDQISDTIWDYRRASSIDPLRSKLIHSTAHLIVRFASDAESDDLLAPHSSGLQSRLCARTLREFFTNNLQFARYDNASYDTSAFCADVNLVAHWANLGYVEEAAIHNHILQSLISHPKLHDHQADALVILFKLAGPTFEAYAEPSVVDRCFHLLKDHKYYDPYCAERNRLQVRATRVVKDGRAKTNFQEVVALRERGWEGLPPPPIFTTGKSNTTSAGQKDPITTPVATSLGLPNRDLEPQIPQSPSLDSVTAPEPDQIPASPVTQSPSISIATLSDFTNIADVSDDEPPINPTVSDTSDDEGPTDPTTLTTHGTFYLYDGNAEVLCGNTLFRVHATVLSFHSPMLRRMFAQTNLDAAESPSGCPRILVSDTPQDFATLLKTIYLPGFVIPSAVKLGYSADYFSSIFRFLERGKVPDFTTFSSLLRVTAKYEMPTVRSQLLEVIRDAYPETFEGLAPAKPIGESVFSGPTPHPNEVLNLFVQQKLTSALPMAYYMAAQRGLDSLMDRHLPASARLSPEILRVAVKGQLALREMELKEIHRLIVGQKGFRSCSRPGCPSRNTTGPRVSEAHQKVIDRITDSGHSGTKLLRVLSLREICGDDCLGFCGSCVEGWEAGHADLRREAWGMLPEMFGLKG